MLIGNLVPGHILATSDGVQTVIGVQHVPHPHLTATPLPPSATECPELVVLHLSDGRRDWRTAPLLPTRHIEGRVIAFTRTPLLDAPAAASTAAPELVPAPA